MSDVDIYVEEQEIKVYLGCLEVMSKISYPSLYRALLTIDSNPKTFNYSDIPTFPDTIDNAELWSIVPDGDRLFYLSAITDTSITIGASVAGDPLPIDVIVLIREI